MANFFHADAGGGRSGRHPPTQGRGITAEKWRLWGTPEKAGSKTNSEEFIKFLRS